MVICVEANAGPDAIKMESLLEQKGFIQLYRTINNAIALREDILAGIHQMYGKAVKECAFLVECA